MLALSEVLPRSRAPAPTERLSSHLSPFHPLGVPRIGLLSLRQAKRLAQASRVRVRVRAPPPVAPLVLLPRARRGASCSRSVR